MTKAKNGALIVLSGLIGAAASNYFDTVMKFPFPADIIFLIDVALFLYLVVLFIFWDWL